MKKVFLYLSAFIILVGFAHKGFSAVTTVTEPQSYTNQTPTPPTTYSMPQQRSGANYPYCHYNDGQYHGSASAAGTDCRVNDKATNITCEDLGNKCKWNESGSSYSSVYNCSSAYTTYAIDMYSLLEELNSDKVKYSSFDTTESFEMAKNRATWIDQYPFNLYGCCYESVGADYLYTVIVCNTAADPGVREDVPSQYNDNYRQKPYCSQNSNSCYSTEYYNYALIKVPYYFCNGQYAHDISGDETNTDIAHCQNCCCKQGSIKKCIYPACNFTSGYYYDINDAQNASNTCNTDIGAGAECISHNTQHKYCTFGGGSSQALNYKECPTDNTASANYDSSQTSNFYYGPCRILCKEDTYCVAYRTYDIEETCAGFFDKNDGTQGFLWFDGTDGSDTTNCVNHENGFQLKPLTKICKQHYTRDFCINTLNGTVGTECSETPYTNNKSTYTKINDGVFSCGCTGKTLSDWEKDKGVPYIANTDAKPCKAFCSASQISSNDSSCYRYDEKDIVPTVACAPSFITLFDKYNNYSDSMTDACNVGNDGASIIKTCAYNKQVYNICKIIDFENEEGLKISMLPCEPYNTDFDLFFDENAAKKDKNYTDYFGDESNVQDGFYYSPCYYLCTTENEQKHCEGWQELSEDLICENILNNNTAKGSEFYTNDYNQKESDNVKICVSKDDLYYQPIELYQVCQGYYSKEYCENALDGNIRQNEKCTVSLSDDNELTSVNGYFDIPISDVGYPMTTYKCSCSSRYKTLGELNMTKSEIPEGTVPCTRDCPDGDINDSCIKYHEDVAIAAGKFKDCKTYALELKTQGYNVFYVDAESPCGTNKDNCPAGMGANLENKEFCVDENSGGLTDIYYGLRYYRERSDAHCAKKTNGKYTEIASDIPNVATYKDCYGNEYTVGGGSCFCNHDGGSYGYEYTTFDSWRDMVVKDMTAYNRFNKNTYINDSESGFCVEDPFTNVPLNKDYPDIVTDDNHPDYSSDNLNAENVVRPSEKLYMYDSIKCKDEFKETNSDWCTNGKNSDISLGWLDEILTQKGEDIAALCSEVYTHGDESNTYDGFCDAEYLLTKYIKENRAYIGGYIMPDKIAPKKYTKWLLSCESIETKFKQLSFPLDITATPPTNSSNLVCYNKTNQKRYISTCDYSYKKCDGPGELGDKTKGICDFYGTTLYKECRWADCSQNAKNVILTDEADETKLRSVYGPDAEITKCTLNGIEKTQVSCDTATHDDKCLYPYTPVNPNNWCRIADSGNLNEKSPKVYKKATNQPTCSLDFSECGKQISDGNNRVTPDADTFLTVTKTASDCYKKYGTAAKTEKCREPNNPTVKYNCYFNTEGYIYTTRNCSIGHDLTIPYIIKKGQKYWNRCDCAPVYKYNARNCQRGLSGQVCVQAEVDQHFVDIRKSDITMIEDSLGQTNTKFYTNCAQTRQDVNADLCPSDPVYQSWPTNYYNCPTNTAPTGRSVIDKCGYTRYECK